MAGILKASTSTYEFSLDDLRALIAADLSVPTSSVTVEYVIQEVGQDPMDRYPGHKQVTKIKVSVDQTKSTTDHFMVR
jgi:hypothetical protein